jgi:hypothetical protein
MMNESIGRIEWPPFLFHYIIVFVCAAFITSVCILKFKYLYWYSQPITFWFTIRRWFRGDDATGRWNNTVMNPLSLAERCNNAIVYPFLHFVRHDRVRVYGGGGGGGGLSPISDAPYERIAEFLSRRDTETPSSSETLCIPRDTLEFILSQDTYGLSAFIGILTGQVDNTTPAIKGDNTPIKGVCILTPRIMLSFGPSSTSSLPPRSVSIYVCDHLAWAKYITSERESLALLETTEYIQKSREIAGEQTLYRYREIPGFVIPFTTVYTYTFAARAASASALGVGVSVIPVSVANFAIFYAFVNEHMRDFRCCILHELSILQSLVQSGIYRIYMLLLNQVRVMAVYIFAPSWMKVGEGTAAAAAAAEAYTLHKTKPKKTIGNRITALHNQISQTSTAVVKYLPPVVRPKYDVFGKRVKRVTRAAGDGGGGGGDILRLISSIQQCDRDTFVRGFYAATAALAVDTPRNTTVISIDTLAHNYRIIDDIVAAAAHWNLLSREKWYYILYNAIIHQETLCKDIAVI